MTTNDLLIRLRYALNIKNSDVVEMFRLGGVKLTALDVSHMLQKVKDGEPEPENYKVCTKDMFEAFLNGLITFKRGPQEKKEGQAPVKHEPEFANNMLIKKVKIALKMTTEDVLDVFYDGGINVSKGELGAILRSPGHRNYKECGDKFARKFLNGLTSQYRS